MTLMEIIHRKLFYIEFFSILNLEIFVTFFISFFLASAFVFSLQGLNILRFHVSHHGISALKDSIVQ